MLNFSHARRIFVAKAVTDMRKSFDTLSALVRSQLGEDPFSGDMFVFVGKRRDRIKVLVWDVSGFWLSSKRLERGTFAVGGRLDAVGTYGAWQATPAEIHALLEGIDVHRATYHQHYRRPCP